MENKECSDLAIDSLKTFADITSTDHRMDGVFLIRVFLGLISDIFDILVVTWIFKFKMLVMVPLLFYLTCMSIFTVIIFLKIPLPFYSQYGFIFFKGISACHIIFLYIVVHYEDKMERKTERRKFKYMFNFYVIVHIFFNIGESVGCMFVK